MRSILDLSGDLGAAKAERGWKHKRLPAGRQVQGRLGSSALAGWQRHEIGRLAEQRQELRAEVLQMQTNADEWARKGGRARLERCGDQQRLCVRVDTQQRYGKEGEIRYVLRGY